MKTKFLSILFFIALVALTGCEPKETTLTGQMFIVTQGAENVKLGDVEILLIEKSQATNFLRNKQAVIESEIASQQQDLIDAQEKIKKAQADYQSFLRNKPYETNDDYVKINSHLAIVLRLQNTFQKQHDSLEAQIGNATSDAGYDMDKFNALLAQRTSVEQSLDIENKVAASLQENLYAIESNAEAENKYKLNTAISDAATAEAKINNYPTVEDYLADFLPPVTQKTISDSDGKFSFSYPRDKSFTIFARAERVILNKKEKYYWLIDAPSGSKAVQILLSNNNLVFVDPDGYFKLKPKEVAQDSVAP